VYQVVQDRVTRERLDLLLASSLDLCNRVLAQTAGILEVKAGRVHGITLTQVQDQSDLDELFLFDVARLGHELDGKVCAVSTLHIPKAEAQQERLF
jgi:hypothetical protein